MMKKNILIFLAFLIGILILKSYLTTDPGSNELRPETTPAQTVERKDNKVDSKDDAKQSSVLSSRAKDEVSAYQSELQSMEKELPTLADLEKLTEEEVHHTPDFILDGAKIIGNVLMSGENEPSKREDSLKFFFRCSANEDIAPSIRALCWNKGTQLITKWDIFIPVSEYNVPDEVKTLAEKIN